ncbi:hypothetical protein T10_1089 [Trichinella papuae]|uniref:Uncharacterized protein n=1 Tax=Trichinella papuae TaxID=268474 RepID=A0A0V1MN11_9BILA|nr:hypothetical protein T10_1089 [Trichinella papuae]
MNNMQTLAIACAYSIMSYVFTEILRYFRVVLYCASLGAHVLRLQTCLVQLPSLPSIQESFDRSCCT